MDDGPIVMYLYKIQILKVINENNTIKQLKLYFNFFVILYNIKTFKLKVLSYFSFKTTISFYVLIKCIDFCFQIVLIKHYPTTINIHHRIKVGSVRKY